MPLPSQSQFEQFQQTVKEFYEKNGRTHLPWRIAEPDGSFDAYKITVSEIMLQQTQVARVIGKYQEFLQAFPTNAALAAAPLSEVLTAWSGLGYNRRARYLHTSSKLIEEKFGGLFPDSPEVLAMLPGIGKNTAGAIVAYSFNQAVPFIETNIRTVYLHHFFKDHTDVSDATLLPLVSATLDSVQPRQWYWALMDYGNFLKLTLVNPNRRSRHYKKQSAFEGSKRQVRGKVLKLLLSGPLSRQQLQQQINDERLAAVLEDLEREELIEHHNHTYRFGK